MSEFLQHSAVIFYFLAWANYFLQDLNGPIFIIP
jgi:hypothetical protein